jgi:hypothetical protein
MLRQSERIRMKDAGESNGHDGTTDMYTKIMPPKGRASLGQHGRGIQQKKKKLPAPLVDKCISNTTEVTIEQVHQSIIDVLEILTDDRQEQIGVIRSLLDKLTGPTEKNMPVEEAAKPPNEDTATPTIVATRPEIETRVQFDMHAFKNGMQGGVPYQRSQGAAHQAKHWYTKALNDAYQKIPTESQQLLVVQSWLQKKTKNDPAIATLLSNIVLKTSGIDMIENLKQMF